MPGIFDDASKATEEMFENGEQMPLEGAETPPTGEETSEGTETQTEEQTETPAEAPTTPEQAALDDAVQTAEVAAKTAAAKDAELQQARQELEAERQRNAQLQGTVDELSQQNQQEVIEEALQPPEIDFGALAFADEATIKAAQAKYAEDFAAYNRQAFLKEFAPVIEQANEAKHAKEKDEVISALSSIPELSGIEEVLPRLDRIIENNKWLSSEDMPMDEKYISAYAILKGVDSINTQPAEPKELTPEELMGLYNSNPAFQEMVEKQRIEQVNASQQVPPFSASSGAVNAALNIKEKPKTFDEASERTRKMFGLG